MHIGVFVRNLMPQMLGIKSDGPTVFVDSKGNIIEAVNMEGGKGLGRLSSDDSVSIVNVDDVEGRTTRFTERIKQGLSKFGEVYAESERLFIVNSKAEDPEGIPKSVREEIDLDCIICISDSARVIKAVCPFADKDIIFNEKDFKEGKLETLDLPDESKEKIEFALYDEDDVLDSLCGKVVEIDEKTKKEGMGSVLDSLVKDEGLVYPISGDIYVLVIREGAQFIKKIVLKQDSREAILEKIGKVARFAEKIGVFIYSSKSGKEKRLTKFFNF
jgi:hypothetical protein